MKNALCGHRISKKSAINRGLSDEPPRAPGLDAPGHAKSTLAAAVFTNRGTRGMNRYRIRRMAERLALKITQDLPQDRFDQELWNLAAIIEEHLFSEMAQLDEAERRTEEAGPS